MLTNNKDIFLMTQRNLGKEADKSWFMIVEVVATTIL